MVLKSSEPGGNGPRNMDTKSKEYWNGYTRGVNSCRGWTDYHNPHPKDSKEYNDYHEGFENALDDLVYSYGSYLC